MNKKEKLCCTPNRKKTKLNKTSANNIKKTTKDNNMIFLPGGEFIMGTDSKEGFYADGEGPARKVTVDPFYIDPNAVSNMQFSKFIKETGYVTEAEKFEWSFVFHLLVSKDTAKKARKIPQGAYWWYAVEGADWAHPEGPDSTITDRLDHPVVHISWNDAQAFCKWAGKRLPTEAEWEYAARGGLAKKVYPWGDYLIIDGKHQCNIWQGDFPNHNSMEDGYLGTAPVNSYNPNLFGLYNTVGNTWEWCSDWFSPNFHINDTKVNPQGPNFGISKVIKGGSYLCHKSYCNRYRVAARSSNTPDSSTGNMGFRCAANA